MRTPILLLMATLCCGPLRSVGAVAIDQFLTVQPIAVCDDAGQNCANADGILAYTEAVTNAVWAQAGIAVTFLPVRQFNKTDYLTTTIHVSNAATDEGRRLLRTPGQQQSSNPTSLNMYFVPELYNAATNAPLNGFGFINGNGIIIGGSPRLDTIAHEIGHNLGLDHTTFGSGGLANVMTDGGGRYTLTKASDVAPDGAGIAQLNAAQIVKARQLLFSVNQLIISSRSGLTGPVPAGAFRVVNGFPAGVGSIETERLKTVRLRYLPDADVDASLYLQIFHDALSHPDAVFNDGGDLKFSPSPVRRIMIDNDPIGLFIDCPFYCTFPEKDFSQWPLGKKATLPDGTIEISWRLDLDNYGEERNWFYWNVEPRVESTFLPAAPRPLPSFVISDYFIASTWAASDPFLKPVPAPFSISFDFTSGFASQGFFDENGRVSTTTYSFVEEPSYGFVSDLRPDPDPAIAIALAVAGIPLPSDVPAPSTIFLLAVALFALGSARAAWP